MLLRLKSGEKETLNLPFWGNIKMFRVIQSIKLFPRLVAFYLNEWIFDRRKRLVSKIKLRLETFERSLLMTHLIRSVINSSCSLSTAYKSLKLHMNVQAKSQREKALNHSHKCCVIQWKFQLYHRHIMDVKSHKSLINVCKNYHKRAIKLFVL